MFTTVAILAASLALARAQVEPSEPSPGRDFQIGGDCEISWTPDPSGSWGQTYIELMTGSNDNMVHLTTVYTFDGTNTALTSYTYPCPDVTPHSAIYFYQFTATGTGSPTWTGRFSISNNHDLVAPENTDPEGVLFGTGVLSNPALAVAAPPTSPQFSGDGGVPVPSSTSTSTTAAATTPPADQTTVAPAPTATNPGQGHPIPPVGATDTPTASSDDTSAADSSPTDSTGAASSLRAPLSALALVGAVALAAL